MPPGPQATAQAGMVLSLLRPGFAMLCSGAPLTALGTATISPPPRFGNDPSPWRGRGRPRCCLPSAGRESSPSGWRGRASSRASLGVLPGRRDSSPDISPSTEQGEGIHHPPHPPPASPATMRVTPPRGRAAGQDCPRAPEPVTAVWLADGDRGAACCLPGPAPLCSPPHRPPCRPRSALPLPPHSGTGTRWCWPPGIAGFGGWLHLIRSRRH